VIWSTAQEFSNKKLDLIKKKGVYPYDYVDNFEKFNNKILPPKKEFFSVLNNKDITDLEYEHAQRMHGLRLIWGLWESTRNFTSSITFCC